VVTAAYGVAILAGEGVAAVVALGTDYLVVRVDYLPAGVDTENPAPQWAFAPGSWHVINPLQSQLTGAEAERILGEMVSAAVAHAASLSGFNPAGSS
jgi:hypothetical protein